MVQIFDAKGVLQVPSIHQVPDGLKNIMYQNGGCYPTCTHNYSMVYFEEGMGPEVHFILFDKHRGL